jgi:hypothetical protein
MTGSPSPYDDDAMRATHAYGEAVLGTLRVGRSLMNAGRVVDLGGLERSVGLLCAKSLDLPPALGRGMRPYLAAVLDELDAVTLAMIRQKAG